VEDTLTALRNLAGLYRGQFNIPVIQVTGSAGKTTTKEMLWAVLSRHGSTLKTLANFNNQIGTPQTLLRLEKVETTPVQTIYPGYVVDTPVEPQIIERVELELHGVEYPEPVKKEHDWIPDTWKEALK
jgi:hypothetical protein